MKCLFYVGEDFETFQDLLESVYEFLEKMKTLGTRDPIEFAQWYNQSLEASHRGLIQRQTPLSNSGNTPNDRTNEQPPNTRNFQEYEDVGTADDLLETQSIARQTGLNVGSISDRTSGYEGSRNESRSIDSVSIASRESIASQPIMQQQTYQNATSQREVTMSQSQTRLPVDTLSSRSAPSSGYGSGEPSRADTQSLGDRTIPANNSRSNGAESSGGIAGLECSVCRDAPAGVVLLNCGHCCACRSCASRLDNCPICRQRIRGTVLIRIA